jgi:hypothetical protein
MPAVKLPPGWIDDHRIFIALCEAGWRGSPCWHIVDWMQWRLCYKYPLVLKSNLIIDPDNPVT